MNGGISEGLSMKNGLFVDKGRELMRLSMKRGIFMDEWGISEGLSMKRGIFMDECGDFGEVVHEMGWFYGKGTRSEGTKERRNEGAKKGGGWRLAGKMLRRGKGRGVWV